MSYSVETPCHNCEKRKSCADHDHLRGAVDGIHMAGNARGHLGSGSIKLTCQNLVVEDQH